MAALIASVYALRAAPLERQDGPVRADLLEDRRRVVGHRVLARLRHAVALLGQDVQQHRALLSLTSRSQRRSAGRSWPSTGPK